MMAFMTDSSARRSALADFLRTRRERITPTDVGLPAGGRRRTPGLRREEVAQLAGVGVTWYTWLEQGRKINVSVHVLEAIARTLRMDSQERWHLFELAGVALVPPVDETPSPPQRVRTILDQLDPIPAVVQSQRYDILAYNRGYNALTGNIDRLEPGERNSIWLFFTDPHWLELCVRREEAARFLVGSLRAAMTPHLDDPMWTSFVARLREASPEFEELWSRHDVTGAALPAKLFRSEVGELNLEGTRMTIGLDGLTRMTVYSPRDDISLAQLKLLVARPASQLSLAG
jgi:transcriptional regulator with XRE-family HTH domain